MLVAYLGPYPKSFNYYLDQNDDVGRAVRPVLRDAAVAASRHAGDGADAGRPLRAGRRPQDLHLPHGSAREMERREARHRRGRALDVRGDHGSEEPDRSAQDRPRTLRAARGAGRIHHPVRREGGALGEPADAGRPAGAAEARLRGQGLQPAELRVSRGVGSVPPRRDQGRHPGLARAADRTGGRAICRASRRSPTSTCCSSGSSRSADNAFEAFKKGELDLFPVYTAHVWANQTERREVRPELDREAGDREPESRRASRASR